MKKINIRELVTAGISFIFLAVSLFSFSGCKDFLLNETEDCENPDYSDCDTKQPYSAFLKMKISEGDELEFIEVRLYKGEIEENELYTNYTEIDSGQTIIKKEVLFEHTYSAEAVYLRDSDTIVCIDGTFIEKKSYTNCDSTCWYVKGDEMDLRLIQK